MLKIPDLTGPLGAGIKRPILFGNLLSGISAFLTLRFLACCFSDPKRTLTPFAIYCLAAGLGSFHLPVDTGKAPGPERQALQTG